MVTRRALCFQWRLGATCICDTAGVDQALFAARPAGSGVMHEGLAVAIPGLAVTRVRPYAE
jgi:hypothetical protein